MKMCVSLINTDCELRVSSVLDKNQKEYGKKNMIDNCEETCWNSAQGSPQWIELRFSKPTSIAELHIQFQGGFAGKNCWVEVKKEDKMEKLHSLYPSDNNSLQISFIIYFA
ncbi:nuclear receptor 2C2-associated protein-like [Uloborus diversus]|uniref:nuclear receptor 2C2-associated protein-like n=1 Tax=Uloborus diversus TaxID=327109 RepID=UPI00240A3158|nr:nuclear receptor 2C2-associated protein-like [Uloborus diversus]